MNKLISKIIYGVTHAAYNLVLHAYSIYVRCRVAKIRKKKKIRFLFVLQDLSQWKSENLYLFMLQHERFDPVLGITNNLEIPGAEKAVVTYCKEKHYEYIMLDAQKTLKEQVHPDVVTFQKPYASMIPPAFLLRKNPTIPFVCIPYGMSSIVESWQINKPMHLFCWMRFFENQSSADEHAPFHLLHGRNYVVTGLPFMDDLTRPRDTFPSPWPSDCRKKHIIYAPHHSLPGMSKEGIGYATFLDNGQFMAEMRDKYKDEVYFVFKPHPLLRQKLTACWGKERVDAYYADWQNKENSHLEQGAYLGLFKHSDALIHDCGSFTVEYFYTGNPAMYLLRDEHHADNMSSYAKEAFNMHEKAYTHEDIERFIQQVIHGEDPKKEARDSYVSQQLMPPHGKKACENIVNAILGEEEYSHM